MGASVSSSRCGIACCVAREQSSSKVSLPASACPRRGRRGSEDSSNVAFFECQSEEEDHDLSLNMCNRDNAACEAMSPCCKSRKRHHTWPSKGSPLCRFPHSPTSNVLLDEDEVWTRQEEARMVAYVAGSVRQSFKERQKKGEFPPEMTRKLEQSFKEIEEWTKEGTVRRMLRASLGVEETAVVMLTKAITARINRRELLRSMTCTVGCDMRIIGQDKLKRPTIYMCARNQMRPIKECIDQVFLAFEAASRTLAPDGQLVLIADMFGLQPSLNMDAYAVKELADSFGTVNADRLNHILIVDFSIIAQACWSMLSTVLTERTRSKINFVAGKEARAIAEERLDAPTAERFLKSLDINRDPKTSEEERASHARRTAVGDVPLGGLEPGDADMAG